jgi:hypothetical protein
MGTFLMMPGKNMVKAKMWKSFLIVRLLNSPKEFTN